MRMITKAGLALLATAAVVAGGAPSASAETPCVTVYVPWVSAVCVDYNTDDPSVQVYCSAFDYKVECNLRRLP